MEDAVSIDTESRPLVVVLPFTDSEYRRRLTELRAAMANRGLDYFISFTPENIYYLTGHDTPGYYFYQACLIGQNCDPVNILRRNETSNTLWRSWTRRVAIFSDRVTTPGTDAADAAAATTVAVLAELGLEGRTVGLEAESWFVTPKRYARIVEGIGRAGGQCLDASGIVEALRVIKSLEEIAYIRAAAKVVDAAMAAAIEASQVGKTENDVAAVAVASLIMHGSEYAGLPPFITSGPRTVLAHSTWSGRRYVAGDVINYELPGVVKRYAAALFRTGVVGEPPVEIMKRAEALVECLEAVIAAMRPGRTSHEVHSAGQDALRRRGYAQLRVPGLRTGYSIGINYPPDWGEGHIMSIQEGDDRPLKRDMTFHLIPTLQEWPTSVVGISDTVLVTDAGCEVLTAYPRDLFVVDGLSI
jgi:Xaa-Pro dipeptidase